MSDGPIFYHGERLMFDDEIKDLRHRQELERLTARLEEMKSSRTADLAQAYEDGLRDASGGAAAKVYRENRVLAATIAALIDPRHPLNVRPQEMNHG